MRDVSFNIKIFNYHLDMFEKCATPQLQWTAVQQREINQDVKMMSYTSCLPPICILEHVFVFPRQTQFFGYQVLNYFLIYEREKFSTPYVLFFSDHLHLKSSIVTKHFDFIS
jgi:hypothetical protein